MKKVLVTGASGFLGRYVVQILEILNYNIDTIGRNEDATYKVNISEHIDGLETYYDAVIHIAGKAHMIPKTEEEKKDFFDVNYKGTLNLINALQKEPKYFVFISSVSVYGLQHGENIKEDTPLKATNPYGKSKIMAEELILDWGKKYNTLITVLRLPLLIGNNPPGNLKSLINSIRRRYYFNVGYKDVRKSVVFAHDVANFIPDVMKIGGIYNLTDGYHPSFIELSNTIVQYFKVKRPLVISFFVAWFMALVGEVIQIVFNMKMPINFLQLEKLTNSLTFNDEKARSIGWNSRSVIEHPNDWLN
ncbi:NAD-dependent epimerase/dehydratase family protein [Flavobacteriaceae bacterium MHTCC 0001]